MIERTTYAVRCHTCGIEYKFTWVSRGSGLRDVACCGHCGSAAIYTRHALECTCSACETACMEEVNRCES